MKWRNGLQSGWYIIADFAASYAVCLLFVLLRRQFLLHDPRPIGGQEMINAAVLSAAWIILYAISGLYLNPFRRSRFAEIGRIFRYTLVGVGILFFAIVIDDGYANNRNYRFSFLAFLAMQFLSISLVHFIITTRTNIRIRKRKITYPTLLIGCGEAAQRVWMEISALRHPIGYDFRGFVSMGEDNNLLHGKVKHLGSFDTLAQTIRRRRIEDVIIALEPQHFAQIANVIDVCGMENVRIKAVPGTYDFLVGTAKTNHILGTPLIDITPDLMRPGDWVAKRLFDIAFSLLALLMLSPLYAILALIVRSNSPGPIFYKQERIGKHGKPFFIYKFRSMYIDAEKMGPALSSDHDPRITPVGRILRKLRLDELPQFWNVLIGDMSIVGPRPERQFYIDQIVQRAPHYRRLQKIRPGITSWGQVKYGYASNVSEMVERLNFDILYLENISFALDIKIILYTIIVMIEGRGK